MPEGQDGLKGAEGGGGGGVEFTWAGAQQDALGRTLLRSWQHHTETPALQEITTTDFMPCSNKTRRRVEESRPSLILLSTVMRLTSPHVDTAAHQL